METTKSVPKEQESQESKECECKVDASELYLDFPEKRKKLLIKSMREMGIDPYAALPACTDTWFTDDD